MSLVLALVASCAPEPAAPPSARFAASDPAVERRDALEEARRCGTALGLAARCNLMRDAFDFAVLRSRVQDGLGSRYQSLAMGGELSEAVDLAALDRLSAVGACEIAPERRNEVEESFRRTLDACGTPSTAGARP